MNKMGDFLGIGDTTCTFYCSPKAIEYMLTPDYPPHGFRVRDCCNRWGHGTYMVPLIKAPRSLGTRAQCSTPSRRSVRELQIKSWI